MAVMNVVGVIVVLHRSMSTIWAMLVKMFAWVLSMPISHIDSFAERFTAR